MGKVEEKIKQELMQSIFNDTMKLYEFIDSRFNLEDDKKSKVIAKINSLNNDLTNLLKNTKLY
jgi:hypothetical protein